MPDFFAGEHIEFFTTMQGGTWTENKHQGSLRPNNIESMHKELGIHSVLTNEGRRWDEINGWDERLHTPFRHTPEKE